MLMHVELGSNMWSLDAPEFYPLRSSFGKDPTFGTALFQGVESRRAEDVGMKVLFQGPHLCTCRVAALLFAAFSAAPSLQISETPWHPLSKHNVQLR